jgi:hypothetical protein
VYRRAVAQPQPRGSDQRAAPGRGPSRARWRRWRRAVSTRGTLALGRKGAASTAELAGGAGWASIRDVLRADIAELYARDTRYGVGMRYTHRGFDPAWLSSPAVRLELVAVVNRIDRRVFHPGTCGELRFVYRMAYQAPTTDRFSSRLPFTANIVFFLPDDGQRCAQRARALTRPEDVPPLVRAGLTLKSVEVNVQTSRWPSTIRPDLGGHADYLLRVFHPAAGGALVPAPLENMPDVDRIRGAPALRKALAAWLRAPGVLDKIDEGTALVPEPLLATRAVSVTPRGLARPQNAPFRGCFPLPSWRTWRSPAGAHIRSPEALLRRLDASPAWVATRADRSRGSTWWAPSAIPRAWSMRCRWRCRRTSRRSCPGVAPTCARWRPARSPTRCGHRPSAAARRARSGTRAGWAIAGFAAWTCAAGFDCVAVDDDRVGQCMPRAVRAGSACHPGAVSFQSDR